MEILNLIDWNYILGILIIVGIIASKIWLVPYLQSKGITAKYYNLIQQALLLGGTMFRTEKVQSIISIALTIVGGLEILSSLNNNEKHEQAVSELADRLALELNITLSKETLDRIVHLAVSLMGEEKK